MRRGRPSWRTRIAASTLRRIDEAVTSAEGATSIWRRFNLQKSGVPQSTFTKWARHRRREIAERDDAPSSPPAACCSPSSGCSESSHSDVDRMIGRAMELLEAAFDAGDIKVYELNGAVRMLVELGRLDIQRQAEERAAELHAARMRAADAELAKLETEGDSGTPRLTAEQVSEIRSKVLGL